ncbi:MAG: carboxypeptidase-like regulatory domain-containing protein [Bacteroidia bacterium]
MSVFSFHAQITVVGKIIDATDKTPIPNVYVSDSSANRYTNSNVNGVFILDVKKETPFITFSHVSYLPHQEKINTKNIKKDTLFIDVFLKLKISELATIDINADKVEKIHKRGGAIIDFAFYNNDVLLLYKQRNNLKLQLLDEFDNVLSEKKLGNKNAHLIKDCMGNTHLLTKDSVFQIVVDSNRLLFYRFSYKQYEDYLQPCVAMTTKKSFFNQITTKHNQGVLYFTVDKTTQEKKPLINIYDKLAEQYARSHYNSIISYYYSVTSEVSNAIALGVWSGDIIDLAVDDKLVTMIGFYKNFAAKPIYTPMHQVRDSVYVFNYFQDTLMVYNANAKLIRNVAINHHYEKGFVKELIVDEEYQNIYGKVNLNGLSYLKKIDLSTGQFSKTYLLEQNSYPENIKIKSGYAYYLHKERNETYTRLYRQKLD